MIKKRKVIEDCIYNIGSSFVCTAMLQLVAYPMLSKELTEEHFGIVLTIMGLVNVVGALFGIPLNNLRLLEQMKSKKELGNFKGLIKNSIIIAIALMGIVIFLFRKYLNGIDMIFLIIIPNLIILRSYISVYYRINLDYKMIFIHMVILAIGYGIGAIVFKITGFWASVFFVGEAISYIFLLKTTEYKNEATEKTEGYKEIKEKYSQLVIGSLIGNLMLYLDRLLITPILGAVNVAIYFTASLVGKTLGIVLQPMSSIILTYITKFDLNSKKLFNIVSVIIVLGGTGTYIASIYISPILIKGLYSETYEMAKPYLNIANLAAILLIIGSLLQPIVLKYCHLYWQAIIQTIYLVVYLVGGIFLMSKHGLYGFCVISVVSNFIRVALLWGVGGMYIMKSSEKGEVAIEKS